MALYIVFGGFLENVEDITTLDTQQVECVGFYKNKEEAYQAWKAISQRDVDQAHKRYFCLPLGLNSD